MLDIICLNYPIPALGTSGAKIGVRRQKKITGDWFGHLPWLSFLSPLSAPAGRAAVTPEANLPGPFSLSYITSLTGIWFASPAKLLNFSTMTFGARRSLLWGRPVHCRMLSGIHGLHLLDASAPATCLLGEMWHQKHLLVSPLSPGGKTVPGYELLFYSVVESSHVFLFSSWLFYHIFNHFYYVNDTCSSNKD